MYILTFLLEPNDLEIFLNRAGVNGMKPQKLFQHERTTADVPTCSCMFNVFVVVEDEK